MYSFPNILNVNHDSVNGVFHPCSGKTPFYEAPVPSGHEVFRPFDQERHLFSRNAPSSGSWSRIKKSGRVKMTPMDVTNQSISDYVAHVDRNSYYYTIQCVCDTSHDGPYDLHSTWREQGDFLYWRDKYPNVPFYQAVLDRKSSQVERAKSSAYSEVLTAYQLGEELGQLALTIEELGKILHAVRHPLADMRDLINSLRGLTRSQRLAAIGSRWLEYRYAIMPLVYSAQDIMKVYKNRHDKYATKRRRVIGEVSDSKKGDEQQTYFFQTASGSIQTHVTCKGHWKSGSLHAYDSVDFNLATTAWELLPLSFVVDWFVNVGDMVAAYAKAFTNTADIHSCVSVRETYQVRTFLHLAIDERATFNRHITCGGAGPINYDVGRGSWNISDLFLREVRNDSYHRSLFQLSDLKFSWAPFLDWRRLLDGSVLTMRQLQRALRRL